MSVSKASTKKKKKIIRPFSQRRRQDMYNLDGEVGCSSRYAHSLKWHIQAIFSCYIYGESARRKRLLASAVTAG